MSDRRVRWSATSFATLATILVMHFGISPSWAELHDPCVDRRLFAGARAARAELRCYSKAVTLGEEVSASCLNRARERVRTDLAACTHEDISEVVEIAETFVGSVVPTVSTSTVGSICPPSKLAAIEGAVTSFVEAEREHLTTGNSKKRTRLRSRAWRVLKTMFNRADVVEPCADRPDVVIAALDDLATALREVTSCSVDESDLVGDGWFVGFGVAELNAEYFRLLEMRRENPFSMQLLQDDDGVGFGGQMSWMVPFGPWPVRGVVTCDGSIFFEKENSISLSEASIWGIVDGNCIRGRVAHGPPGSVWIPWAALRWGSAGCVSD
jgi:hypothetical protein